MMCYEPWDFEFRLHAQFSNSMVSLNHHKYVGNGVSLSELKSMFECA